MLDVWVFMKRDKILKYECCSVVNVFKYSRTCLKWTLSKRPYIGFQDQISLNAGQKYGRMLQISFNAGQKYCRMLQISFNAGQKYCRMLQGEHSAILSTLIKLPFVRLFLSGRFPQVFLYNQNLYIYEDLGGINLFENNGRRKTGEIMNRK